MGPDLDKRPDEDTDKIQSHYDREFGDMMSHFNENADSSSEDDNIRALDNAESNPNSGGSEDDTKSVGDDDDSGKGGSSAAKTAALGAAEIGAAEAGGAGGVAGFEGTEKLNNGFNPSDEPGSKFAKAAVLLKQNRRKALISGGGIGGVFGIIAIITLFIVPLRIEGEVNQIHDRFYAASQDAVDKETDNMFATYVTKFVIPGYSHCGTTISKECSAKPILGTDPVSRLFNDWRTTKLENKLATNYGLEIQKHSDGTWSIRTNGASTSIGTDGETLTGDWLRTNNATAVRQAARDSIETDSKAKQVFTRFKVARLLKAKYGIRYCLNFCNGIDAFHGNVAAQKISAKLWLNEKVIAPFSDLKAAAIKCVLDSSCNPDQNDKTASDPEEGGAPESDFEQTASTTLASDAAVEETGAAAISDQIAALAAEKGVDAAALDTEVKSLVNDGLQKYLIKSVLSGIGVDIAENTTADTALDKIPYVGWINLGTQLINGANSAGPKLKALSYTVNVSADIKLWQMYQSYADEVHTGNVTSDEVGSMTDSLGGGDNSTPDDPQIGGTASAEQTPLYNSMFGNQQPASTGASLISSLIPGHASADSPSDNAYSSTKCLDGNGVPKGAVVCSEQVLAAGNAIANDIHTFLALPGVDILTAFSSLWGHTIGEVFKFVGSALQPLLSGAASLSNLTCSIPVVGSVVSNVTNPLFPGACEFKDALKTVGPKILSAAETYLLPSGVGPIMSGGRTSDSMIAGGDAAGNVATQDLDGGTSASPAQMSAIVNDQTSQNKVSFQRQSYVAQLFDRQSQYSLVTKIAMIMPTGLQNGARRSFAAIISNPFSAITHSFGSLLTHSVSADDPAQADPFGIPQIAVEASDIPADPSAYWQANCIDNAAQGYQNDATYAIYKAGIITDSATEQSVPTVANKCVLIKTATGALGGLNDTGLLTTEETAGISGQ